MTDNTNQGSRFKQSARALGVDESDDALDRIMGKLDLKKKAEAEKQKEAKDE